MRRSSVRTGSPAFRHGFGFGVILGIIEIVLALITAYTNVGGSASIIGIVGGIVAIVIYLFAGILATRQTGRVSTGAFAGLWTGVVSSILGFIATLVFTSLNIDSLRRAAQAAGSQLNQPLPAITNQTVFQAALVGGALGILFALVLGLVLGAIGGLIGKIFARPASVGEQVPSYQEPLYRDTSTPPQNRR